MTKDEALKLALEALESCGWNDGYNGKTQYFDDLEVGNAITALREVLDHIEERLEMVEPAQERRVQQQFMDEEVLYLYTPRREALDEPVQEPTCWMTPDGEGWRMRTSPPINDVPLGWMPLYSSPPRREWVGLTDEEIKSIDWMQGGLALARTVEAKLKEKNCGS